MNVSRKLPHMLGAVLSLVGLSASLVSCSSAPLTIEQPLQLGVEVVAEHPFDPTSFTQGLEVADDRLLVSTGMWGETRVYYTDIDSAAAAETPSVAIPDERVFGEGITKVGPVVWQLTWRNGVAYKRNADTLEELGTAQYSGEGWGLCNFEDTIVMSDGTAGLRFLDPETFVERDRFQVQMPNPDDPDQLVPVDKLNELDCTIDDEGRRIVYANRFLTSDIYGITVDEGADQGRVVSVIDASSLESHAAADPNNVLNGIARIPGTDRYLLSGKRWPVMYEVRFVPR